MKVLITSGGTKVPIDSVRHISNMSSGTFGAKIAKEFLKENQSQVCFFKAEHSKSPYTMEIDLTSSGSIENDVDFFDLKRFYKDTIKRYSQGTYKTYQNYHDNLLYLVKNYNFDIIVLAAAVSDYGVENKVSGKIRSKEDLTIKLKPLPKLISKIREISPKSVLVGFKLMVDVEEKELIQTAKKSCIDNDCDFVVANDLINIQNGNHVAHLVHKNGQVSTYSPSNGDNPAKWIVFESIRYYVGKHNNQGDLKLNE